MYTAESQKGIPLRGIKNTAAWGSLKDYLPAVLAIIALICLGQILSPGFASFQNLFNVLNSGNTSFQCC